MRLKEIFLAVFVTILFLCAPIAQTVSCEEVNKINESINTISIFKVKLTEKQVQLLNDFIEKLPSIVDKNIAKSIVNQILSNNEELDVVQFGGFLREYGYENISHYQETTNIVDDLLNFIMQLINDRLGWVYDLLQKTSDVISDTQRLWNDKSLPKEILNELKLLIEKLRELQNLSTFLIDGNYWQFLKAWDPGIIIQDITIIIQSVEQLANDFGILTGDIIRFISDTSNFINWFAEKPWEQPIHIYGRVMKLTTGLSNVTINCRGIANVTDEEGYFSFFVNSTPDDYSIPPNVQYGIHQCIITAEKNGTIKETPAELSYVFSDGSIYWIFLMNKDSINKVQTKSVNLQTMGLWSWICSKNNKNLFLRYILQRYWSWLISDAI